MKSLISKLEAVITPEMEAQNREDFTRSAVYVGNGIYMWRKQYSNDMRELFLMGIACIDLRLNQILIDHEHANQTSIHC